MAADPRIRKATSGVTHGVQPIVRIRFQEIGAVASAALAADRARHYIR
jgi:hypothetical protein